jgi:hypothetical protein
VEITKLRNEFTESLYEAEKVNIKREMKRGYNVNERLMFHGTHTTDPLVVVSHRHGMMKDYASQDDLLYGKGVYFAELARYSQWI